MDVPNSGRLTQPLVMPGTRSAFNGLPSAALQRLFDSGAQSVATHFSTFSYDPHANASGATNVTSMTRLLFADAATGAEIAMNDLSTAVRFTIDTKEYFTAAKTKFKSACAFYDNRLRAYSTAGCATLPNPAPERHTLTWNADASVGDVDFLGISWSISGPLAAGCSTEVLDCRAAPPGAAVYFNTPFPLTAGRVTCQTVNGTRTRAVLKIFTGDGCQLYNKNNSLQCYWDAGLQAFEGKGCVVSTTTSCRWAIASNEPPFSPLSHPRRSPLMLMLLSPPIAPQLQPPHGFRQHRLRQGEACTAGYPLRYPQARFRAESQEHCGDHLRCAP